MTMTEQEYKTAWEKEPDAHELAEMAEKVKRTYTLGTEAVPQVDVDEEWRKFSTRHPMMTTGSNGWHRWAVAASLLLVCTLGLAWGWNYMRNAQPAQTAAEPPTVGQANDTMHEDDTRMTFSDATLLTILQELATRHGAQVRYHGTEEIRLYVELEKSWTLQQCVDFLNHFEHVSLRLTADNIIVAE